MADPAVQVLEQLVAALQGLQGNQAVAAAGNTMKLQPFSSGTGADFLSWRHHFNIVRVHNGWNDQSQRRHLAAAMQGTASQMVRDIPYDGPDFQRAQNPLNINHLLTQYEGRFISASESHMAITQFETASQADLESVLVWHGRLRELFQRSHPNVPWENDQRLIRKFTFGLLDAKVQEFVLDSNPQNYNQALEMASNKTATRNVLAANKSSSSKQVSTISADDMDDAQMHVFRKGNGGRQWQPANNGGRCFSCNRPGHFRADCPLRRRIVRFGNSRGFRFRSQQQQQPQQQNDTYAARQQRVSSKTVNSMTGDELDNCLNAMTADDIEVLLDQNLDDHVLAALASKHDLDIEVNPEDKPLSCQMDADFASFFGRQSPEN